MVGSSHEDGLVVRPPVRFTRFTLRSKALIAPLAVGWPHTASSFSTAGDLDKVRYFIALIVVVATPPAIIFWLFVHPLISFWRKLGPVLTYVVMTIAMVGLGALIYRAREALLRVEFGFSWALVVVGLLLYGSSIYLERHVRKQLKLSIFFGLAELRSKDEPRELLTEGVYARVRHPRYLGAILGLGGMSFIANYPATYVLAALLIPALYIIAALEERELVDRFGERYEQYRGRVPRLFPSLRAGESES